MSNQFANLLINRIIVHQVFERDENREIQEPRYNNSLTILDPFALSILQDRIIDVLGHNSHSVEMDIVKIADTDTFGIAAVMLDANSGEFILKSQNIAYKLAESHYLAVAERAGHADPSTPARIYGHVTVSMREDAATKIEEAMSRK